MSRARDLGLPFPGTPGPLNAITDVAGVSVGFCTLQDPDRHMRTGVTAIIPRMDAGNPEPVRAGQATLNGNGEMTGTTWIEESGFLEGPVILTNTSSVGTARDAAVHRDPAGMPAHHLEDEDLGRGARHRGHVVARFAHAGGDVFRD